MWKVRIFGCPLKLYIYRVNQSHIDLVIKIIKVFGEVSQML